jgi:hypothetical protein
MSTPSLDFGRSYSEEYILDFYPDTPVRSLISVDLKSQVSSDVMFPLRLRPSKIYDLFEQILSNNSYKQPSTQKPWAKATKWLLGIGALIGRVPFIPLSSTALKHQTGFNTVYAIANFVSYSSFFIWAAVRMVNRSIISLDVVRRKEDKRCEVIQRSALMAFNILNAAIAQTPLMYLAYKYNPEKPWIVALSVCDLFFPAYSMQTLYRKTIESCRQSDVEKRLSLIKKELIQSISYHQKRVQNLQDIPFVINTNEGSLHVESFGHFINHICSIPYYLHTQELLKTQSTCDKYPLISPASILGYALTGCVLSWMGYVVYNMCSSFTDNEAFIACGIGYIVLWNMALLQDVLVSTSYDFISSIKELTKCRFPMTYLTDQIWPISSYSVMLACLSLAMFGAIPAYKASKDILPYKLEIPSSILLGLSLAFLSYRPMRELSHDALCLIIDNFGSHEDKLKIQYQKRLDLLKEYILLSDIPEMARLVLQLDPDLSVNPLISTHRFQQDELFMYCRPS